MIKIKVTFNGTEYRVPDGEILHLKKIMGISATEAAKIYLEDNGRLINAEQEALDKKAKASKITQTIHGAQSDKPRKTADKSKSKNDNADKERIIADIAEKLSEYCDNVEITNKAKIIEFSFGGQNFKFDLIKRRG